MNNRKIIQIAVCESDDKHSLYALCDDGTLWIQCYRRKKDKWGELFTDYYWQKEVSIPQPDDGLAAAEVK